MNWPPRRCALSQAEQDVASGDLYSWAYNTLRLFKQPYKVEIPEIGQPAEGNVDLIDSFPYKEMSLVISGRVITMTSENLSRILKISFPHIRVTSLIIDQTAG